MKPYQEESVLTVKSVAANEFGGVDLDFTVDSVDSVTRGNDPLQGLPLLGALVLAARRDAETERSTGQGPKHFGQTGDTTQLGLQISAHLGDEKGYVKPRIIVQAIYDMMALMTLAKDMAELLHWFARQRGLRIMVSDELEAAAAAAQAEMLGMEPPAPPEENTP